jgi:hypothetical protein
MEEIEHATLNSCCELIYAKNNVAYLGEGQGREVWPHYTQV